MNGDNVPVYPRKGPARRRFGRRSILLLLGLCCIAITSLNCGVGFPPRLWKCQCRQVCLDQKGQETTIKQYACGYSRTQATQFAEHHCAAKAKDRLAGCKRVSCSCTGCMVSRKQICRRRPGRSRVLGTFVVGWVTSLFDLDNDGYYDDPEEDDDELYDDDFFDPDDPEEPGPPPGYGPIPSHIPPPGYNDPPSGSDPSDSWDSSDAPSDDWADDYNSGWDDPGSDTTDDTWSDPGDDDWTDDPDDWGDDDWGDDDWDDDDDW